MANRICKRCGDKYFLSTLKKDRLFVCDWCRGEGRFGSGLVRETSVQRDGKYGGDESPLIHNIVKAMENCTEDN